MLVNFRVSNFRSFRDEVVFSMVASASKENYNHLRQINKGMSLLPLSVIYGANASGKSNLHKAMLFMKRFVLSSLDKRVLESDPSLQPFRLSVDGENKPAFFEIVFYINNIFYRYGFEVDKAKVLSEWLYARHNEPKKHEICYFYRDNKGKIRFHRNFFGKVKGIVEKDLVRKDSLLLTVAANFNVSEAEVILSAFKNFNFIGKNIHLPITVNRIESKGVQFVLDFLRIGNVDIDDLKVKKMVFVESSEGERKSRPGVIISSLHKKYDADGREAGNVAFDFVLDESDGTLALFEFAGPIYDTIERGAILVVDEMDTSLHPLIVREICNIFLSKKSNPNNAQLIFTTHDVSLLRDNFLRRDEVWFLEKDVFGASHLYSLVEFKRNGKKVRKDESYEKGYLSGRYGALPIVGDWILDEQKKQT